MKQPVLQLPHATLTRPAAPVTDIDDEVHRIMADLLDTMRATPHSVGIAAPQIGVSLQIFCIDVSGHKKARSCHGEFTLINPEVIRARMPDIGREGCMSVPELTGDVARATEVVVRGLDPSGAVRVLEVDAFEARAVLHEIDHLRGNLFLDRVISAEHVFHRKVYR